MRNKELNEERINESTEILMKYIYVVFISVLLLRRVDLVVSGRQIWAAQNVYRLSRQLRRVGTLVPLPDRRDSVRARKICRPSRGPVTFVRFQASWLSWANSRDGSPAQHLRRSCIVPALLVRFQASWLKEKRER